MTMSKHSTKSHRRELPLYFFVLVFLILSQKSSRLSHLLTISTGFDAVQDPPNSHVRVLLSFDIQEKRDKILFKVIFPNYHNLNLSKDTVKYLSNKATNSLSIIISIANRIK